MSKSRGNLNTIIRVSFLVLVALLLLTPFVGGLILIFFIPIAGWYIWSTRDKVAEMEKRLAALEKPRGRESDKS